MEVPSIFEIWNGLVLWQKVVVGMLIPATIALATYGKVTGKIPEDDDSGLIDLSIFKNDRFKLFGIAVLLFLFTFIVLPYILF
ncbi:MAG: hypothetical protein ACI93R_001269 [Flavobacteriales bacterium]|jgi:hypothetical protein